jgi:hypothetical protein
MLINKIINKELNRKLTTTILKSSKKYHSPLTLSQTPLFFKLFLEVDNNTSQKNSTNMEVYNYKRRTERK